MVASVRAACHLLAVALAIVATVGHADDVRLRPPKDLDGFFPFTPPATREAWEARRAEVRRRIMLGTYALSAGYYDAYYRRAQQVRTLIKADFEQAFSQVDLLATPTSPTVAFKVGQRLNDPLAMYLSDVCTLPVNLAGVPALVVPCGFSESLPVGLQLIGRPFEEELLLRAGDAYQQVTPWHTQRPDLVA